MVTRISGAAWSFAGASLSESVAIYRALGVEAIDLIAGPGALLDPATIAADPRREAAAIQRLGSPIANLIVSLGANFIDRALNHPAPSIRSQNRRDFQALVEFCECAAIPSITALPGVDQNGLSHEDSLQIASDALNEIAILCHERDVRLLFEPHVKSVLENPAEVLDFVKQNPAIGLTLDYSHFVYNGYNQSEVDALAPYAGHVHLRQAALGVLQAKWEEGIIDFQKVVQVLQHAGYTGYYGLEYEHDEWLDNNKVDVMSETIKMRNAIKPLLLMS
jgi:sugar phosphate isomerase/epimerase